MDLKALHESGSRHGADGWLDQLKSENGGQASLVETGYNKPDRHIATKGDAQDKPTRPKPGDGW